MRRFLCAVAGAMLVATGLSYAQSLQPVPVLENESTGLWFVELSSAPAVDGTSVAMLEREEAAFHEAATTAGVRYSEGRHFRKLWNGLTVRASSHDIPKLQALRGVQAVCPVLKIKQAQVDTRPLDSADLTTAIKMTGVDIAQSELGLTGHDVRVAVIDSGIDYNHPDLGGCFGPGCRVTLGYDLVGDDFDSGSPDPAQQVPHPDPDPDDCNGHGTHVSGIIGANGGITGVAPGVTFHAYRVFGCEGSTTADIMLAAMEMALDDGADVLNMSIGSALAWPQYPTAKGANRLVKQGIVVVASIGNEGALGLYGASAPGVGKDVIGVASFDNSHTNLVAFTVSPDDAKVGYVAADGAPPPPVEGSAPLVRTGTAASVDDACNALAPGSLARSVALIRRGTCAFSTKALNAQAAGAAGVVLYNNASGIVTPTVTGSPVTIPVVAISAANGILIDGRLAAGPVTMTWTSLIASEPQATGGLVSSFSSYGLAPDLSFKPDLGAPGGSIRSTLPLEQGGYGNLSGTSMSSPHVAGAVALLLEARPGLNPLKVQERLQNSARPHLWSGDSTLGFLELVHRQGAGMLQIDAAVLADAVVSPSSLALGEIESGSVQRLLRISSDARDWRGVRRRRAQGGDRVTYTLGYEPALSTGANTFTPSFIPSFASVQFSEPSIVLENTRFNHEAGVVVTVTPPANPAARLFGGYITLTPDDGGTILRVPFSGYNGDYQAIQALTPTPAGFPWLAKLSGTSLFNQPQGATYTLTGPDVPYVLLHLDHPGRSFKLDVIDVTTNESVGFADIEDFVPRNSAATSAFLAVWDGTTVKRAGGKVRTAPNGAYRFELSVLKALGDETNPAHFEHWTSPTVVISRPVGP